MRLLASTTSGAGHFRPLLAVLSAAARAGAEIIVAAPSPLSRLVVEAGYRHVPAGDVDQDEEASLRRSFAAAEPKDAAVIANREIFGRLCTQAMLPRLAELATSWRPDLIVHEPAEFAAAMVGERTGMPHVQVAISAAEVEHRSLEIAAPVLEPLQPGVVRAITNSPYLTRFPAEVDPSPYPDTRRFRADTGPSGRRHRRAPGEPPLVYLSFGTVTAGVHGASAIYSIALAAIADLPVRALLTLGPDPERSTLGSVPDNVEIAEWVAQEDVLLRADLVVCHGGSGTTFGALAAGVPLVVVPMFADQPVNAGIIAALGAGIVVAPPPGPMTELSQRLGGLARELRAAITTTLTDPAYQTAARAAAARLAAVPPIDSVFADI